MGEAQSTGVPSQLFAGLPEGRHFFLESPARHFYDLFIHDFKTVVFGANFNFFSQDWKATQTFISHEKRRWLSQALLRAADVGWAGSGVTLGCRAGHFNPIQLNVNVT